MFVSTQVALVRPFILVGNKIVLLDVHLLEGLINLPQMLLYCNAFLVPSSLATIAIETVKKSATMLANVVLLKDQALEADG